MITFFNTFLSYLLLVIISMVIIVLAIFCGKKLRDRKDAKDAAVKDQADVVETPKEEE